MVELADTLDLGSSGQPCRFKSCQPHHRRKRHFCLFSLFFKKRKAALLHLFSPLLATKRNSQFVASKNASIFGEKEHTSDSVSMFASANKRQERSLRRRRDLIRFILYNPRTLFEDYFCLFFSFFFFHFSFFFSSDYF